MPFLQTPTLDLSGRTIVRLVLDRADLGGAILDVDVLDRALVRRHDGLTIHRLYFSATEHEPQVEQVGTSALHWHPILYDKTSMEADRVKLISALRKAFVKIDDSFKASLFVNHVPENQPGIFLSHVARERGVPVFSMFHGGSRPRVTVDAEHARAVDVVAANLRASAGLANAVGAVSRSAGGMTPMTRVHNVGTAADSRFFDAERVAPGALRKRFGFPAPLPILLLSGRMVPEKGHKMLLDASDLLHAKDVDHRIVFAGSASPDVRREIENYLASNGFRGVVGMIYDATQEEMVEIYRDADIVVLPTFHFEGCPRCLIEAGLMEKAVVATDAGGTREAFLPGESGLLVPVGDVAALAAALEDLVLDPARRAAMGRAGREFACSRFDPDALAARHEAVYADLMERFRG
jgi:glycosyltransferase involved in cell wall biosynthesis